MFLSTSTNILCERPGNLRATIEQSMLAAHHAGFRYMDINFYDWSRQGAPFLTQGWEAWIAAVAQLGEQLDVRFHQSHCYCYNFTDSQLPETERAYQQMLVERSLCCMLAVGVKVVVLHPETDFGSLWVKRNSHEASRRYVEHLLEITADHNISFAIENMCDRNIAPLQRFCSQPEELLEFVQSFGTPRVGVCWDLEHGGIMQQDQPAVIRLLGKHLLALHVSDSLSDTDGALRHVLPFFGRNQEWAAIMVALKETGYQGAFSFEAHNYSNRIPDPLIPVALRLMYDIGAYLLALEKRD